MAPVCAVLLPVVWLVFLYHLAAYVFEGIPQPRDQYRGDAGGVAAVSGRARVVVLRHGLRARDTVDAQRGGHAQVDGLHWIHRRQPATGALRPPGKSRGGDGGYGDGQLL